MNMNADLWSEQMNTLLDLAGFLAQRDVIDIHFAGNHTREVFVASRLEDRVRGLSHQPNLQVDGMIFIFQSPSHVPFSMKDMAFDIDLSWYDSEGKLLGMRSCSAGSTEPVACPSPIPFSYVLEAPVGTIPYSDLKVKVDG